jgi:spermidine synthase
MAAHPDWDVEVDEFGGHVVSMGGYPQSYVSLSDPGLLVFGYVQHLAAVIDTLQAGPLAVTHVGGAGLTLPRYVEHTRPGSTQVVLEPNEALTTVVRKEIPLPRGHRIRVRPVDGREGMRVLRDASADVVVVDAFAENRVPADLTSSGWFADVARVLRPGGAVLVNTADEVDLRHLARLHASVRTAFPAVLAVAQVEVWKRRRFGNIVLAAGAEGALDVAAVRRQVAGTAFPSTVLDGAELARRLGSARPFTDDDCAPSPPPPLHEGEWRLR